MCALGRIMDLSMKGLTQYGLILIFIGSFITILASGQSQSPNSHPKADPPDANPQYFPTGAFDIDLDPSFRFPTERWYAKHLRAMSEPSLFASSSDETLQVYRFLWLRTFDRPVAIRLTVGADGTGTVVAKMLNGHGGYAPGTIVVDRSVEANKEQVQKFFKLLADANFWSTETERYSGGRDGAQWIVEGVQNGQYHIVDRWSPDKKDDSYRSLCLYLLELGGVQEKEVY
jgi:hypothetical protein